MDDILALDVSIRSTGVAFGRQDRPFTSSFPLPSVEGSEEEGWDYGDAGAKMLRFLDDHLKISRPDYIIYETPLPARAQSNQVNARALIGLGFLIEAFARVHRIECAELHNATLKKFWAGHGYASKEDMMSVCQALAWPVKNHDEADAAALWAYGRSTADPDWAARTVPLFGRRIEA